MHSIISFQYVTFVVTLLFTIVAVFVTALPSGAPVCTVNEAAPQSPHTDADRNPVLDTIESAGFVVKFDGVDLTNGLSVAAGTPIKVVLTSTSGSVPMKGTLMIVSQPNVDIANVFTLSEEEKAKLQVSVVCPFDLRSGVTHINNDVKTSFETTLTFTKAYTGLFFDVNIVTQNNNQQGSFYYYTQYKFDVTSAPTPAPTQRGCGLFGLSIFCPLTLCGCFGKLIFGDEFC